MQTKTEVEKTYLLGRERHDPPLAAGSQVRAKQSEKESQDLNLTDHIINVFALC